MSSLLCPNYISLKFGKNPTIGSQGIVQRRKCDANANANADANADVNGMRTKNNMPPPLRLEA